MWNILQLTIILSSLIYNVQSFIDNLNLKYETLSKNKEGRHFLVTTLLEKLYQPLNEPRFQGKVVFQLPRSLGGSDRRLQTSCCQLKEIPFSYRRGVITKDLVIQSLEKKGLLKYKRGSPIDDFEKEVKADISSLADVINGDQRPFDHMLSLAAVTREIVNENMWVKAMITVEVRRTDLGFAVPNMLEVMGPSFLPNIKQLDRQVRDAGSNGRNDAETEIVVDWSSPQYRTYPPSELESKLWYLREDPEVNSHHWYWHVLFGDMEEYNQDDLQHRRGELFYYLHNQVCNRYNMERLSNGMPLVKPFDSASWSRGITPGYDPKLGDLSTDYYPPRENGALWYNHPESTRQMRTLERNFQNSIKKGYLSGPNGEKVPLGYKNGRDFGIIPLGATIETDPRRTVNNETYGDIHNGGHYWMARAGLHKQLVDVGVRNALGNTATECRDPLLYRWHAYIDGIFAQYKQTLGPYKNEDLEFPGITINDVTVHAQKDPDFQNGIFGKVVGPKNQLFTHMELGDVGFYGADIGNITQSDRVRIKYRRLNHSPFVYRFTVTNSGPAPVDSIVRVFLADEKGTPTTVEMDKFFWRFKRGTTEFERSSDDSSSVPRKALGLYEIQEQSSYSGSYNYRSEDILQYTGCGWPKHLLVPRGSPTGFKTNLLVVISPLLPDDAAKRTDWKTVSSLTHSLCGAPGDKYPDSRPMGYPFDRYRGWRSVMRGRSNMKRVEVTIFHQKDCTSDKSCPSGQYCDLDDNICRLGASKKPTSSSSFQFPKAGSFLNKPKKTLILRNANFDCPSKEGAIPKVNQQIFNGVTSESDCQTRCRKTQECSYYEWHKLDGQNDFCVLFEHLTLDEGHPDSVSGLTKCNSFQELFETDTCYLKDSRPILQKIRSKSLPSADICKSECASLDECESWEWQTSSSKCHLYKMFFKKQTNSYSGPVICKTSV